MKVINTVYLIVLLMSMSNISLHASDLRYQIDALIQQAYSIAQAIPLPDEEESSYGFEEEDELSKEVVADSAKPSLESTLKAIKQLSQDTHYRLYGQQAINQLTALISEK